MTYPIDEFTRVHAPTGRVFAVTIHADDCHRAPHEESDCHGVVVELDFDPTDDMPDDELDYNLSLMEDDTSVYAMEKRLQYRMMRKLSHNNYGMRRGGGTYYDVWSTLKLAQRQWGTPDSTLDELHDMVERDYEYLRGWYDDDWHWCGVEVVPIETPAEAAENYGEDDPQQLDEYAESLWGVEYGLPTSDSYIDEVVADLMEQSLQRMQAQRDKNQRLLALDIDAPDE